MNKCVQGSVLLVLVAALMAGCGKSDNASGPAAGTPGNSAEKAGLLLATEPAGAKGVLEIRKEAKNGDDVVIVGKVGGSREPLVKGLAAFTIVDTSLKSCDQIEGDTCECPWDYCCVPDLDQSMAMIEFVDAQGKTLRQDARELLGIKELQTVVLRGKAQRDDKNNLTIVASGLYVRQP